MMRGLIEFFIPAAVFFLYPGVSGAASFYHITDWNLEINSVPSETAETFFIEICNHSLGECISYPSQAVVEAGFEGHPSDWEWYLKRCLIHSDFHNMAAEFTLVTQALLMFPSQMFLTSWRWGARQLGRLTMQTLVSGVYAKAHNQVSGSPYVSFDEETRQKIIRNVLTLESHSQQLPLSDHDFYTLAGFLLVCEEGLLRDQLIRLRHQPNSQCPSCHAGGSIPAESPSLWLEERVFRNLTLEDYLELLPEGSGERSQRD